jgi:hypothetical protein
MQSISCFGGVPDPRLCLGELDLFVNTADPTLWICSAGRYSVHEVYHFDHWAAGEGRVN